MRDYKDWKKYGRETKKRKKEETRKPGESKLTFKLL